MLNTREQSPIDVSRGCVLDFNQKKFSLLIFVYLFLFFSPPFSEIFLKARLKGFPFQIIYTSINLLGFVIKEIFVSDLFLLKNKKSVQRILVLLSSL